MWIIIALAVLALIILIHEWGHFIAARTAGIQVLEFSIGFGPKLFSINRKEEGQERGPDETEYSLRLFPIGGFVRMAGEMPDDEDSPWGFNKASPLQRMKVLVAGAGMNFVLAILLFIVAFTLIGIPQPIEQPIIGKVVQGKSAADAGLLAGDRIISIGGQKVATWDQAVQEIQKSKPRQNLLFVVQRGDKTLSIMAKPEFDLSRQVSVVGISATVNYDKKGLWEGIKLGFVNTYLTTVMMLQGLVQIFSGAVSAKQIAGPVGITRMIGEAAQGGLVYLFNFTALLSINLGVINLLPFPALDGSRILFTGFEMVRGRPVEPERESFIHLVGFVILLSLIALVTFNDIVNLIKGY